MDAPFKWQLNDDRTEATIEIGASTIRATALELENAVAYLGGIRSLMSPEVSREPDLNRLLPVDLYRAMHRTPGRAPMEGGALLLFRSPLFGWFQLALQGQHCSELLSWLAATPEADAATSKH